MPDRGCTVGEVVAPPRSDGERRLRPRLVSRGPELAERRSADQMRLQVEGVVDGGVSGEEALG